MFAGLGPRGQFAFHRGLGQHGCVGQHGVQRLLLLRRIGRVFHHLIGLAVQIEDGVVVGLNPNFLAALANPLEPVGDVLAPVQPGPEVFVFRALPVGVIDEHAVVFAFDLVERVAQRLEEIVVGRDNGSIHLELDHRLRLADGRDLAGIVGVAQLLFGDVGGIFHYLEGFAAQVQDGVVGSQNPDFPAALADALEFVGHVFAAVELRPELFVVRALAVGVIDKHAVVFALDFVERVAQRLEEIVVGVKDRSLHGEFNHRLRLPNGGDLFGMVVIAQFAFGDVGHKLHDPIDFSVDVGDRIVGASDPHLPVAFGQSAEFTGLRHVILEFRPERRVFRQIAIGIALEDSVVLALDFFDRVTRHPQEKVVGAHDIALDVELDAGPRIENGLHRLFQPVLLGDDGPGRRISDQRAFLVVNGVYSLFDLLLSELDVGMVRQILFAGENLPRPGRCLVEDIDGFADHLVDFAGQQMLDLR